MFRAIRSRRRPTLCWSLAGSFWSRSRVTYAATARMASFWERSGKGTSALLAALAMKRRERAMKSPKA